MKHMNAPGLIFTRKKILIGCLFLMMNSLAFAQQNEFENKLSKNWSLSLNAGPTIYWGYFSDSKSVNSAFQHAISFGYGIVLTKQLSPVFGIRGQILMGTLKARKDFYGDGMPADLNFSSDLAEENLSAKISITDLVRGYNPKRALSFYGLAGIGLSNFNGRVVHSTNNETLYTIGKGSGKGINGWELDGMALLGAGLSYRLNKDFDITAETSMRFLQTDKLGRVHGLLRYDMYSYSSIGITYKIGVKKEAQPKKTLTVENKPAVVNKSVVTEPVKVENKPAEVKKDVVATNVPAKVENKLPATEPTKKEVAKPVEKVVPAEQNYSFTGYKVQIIATRNPITIEVIKKEYNIIEEIRADHFDQWNRFSVGEFKTFKEAKAYSRQLIKSNNTKDAFVVKFVNGKRVGPVYK